ncbi:MAG: hypothetical protein J5580_03975 [Clostridia bacterium]|nr:hypothetical protein [Clostridia bacterium]
MKRPKLLTHTREGQFNPDHCKVNTDKKAIDDTMQKGRILEAELHKELLDDELPCSREYCQGCPSLLC